MRSSWFWLLYFVGFISAFQIPLPEASAQSLRRARRHCPVTRLPAAPVLFYAKTYRFSVQKSLISNTKIVLHGGATTLAAPALKQWIGPALLCALSYALYNVFIKKASTSIDPVLGGVLLQFVAAFLGLLLYFCKCFFYKASSTVIGSQASGILWAVAAGAAVGAAEILSFIISGMGVQAMQSIPIIIGGSVLFGTILGKVWLREALGVRGYIGVLLISAGIALVGMDPATSMH